MAGLSGLSGLRFVSALDPELEAAISDGLYRAGHDIVARAAAEEAADVAADQRADVVLVAAPDLTRALVARCDAAAVRMVALARNADERRCAIEVDLLEIADPHAGWDGVAACLALAPLEPAEPGERAPRDRALVSEMRLVELEEDSRDEIPAPARGRPARAAEVTASLAAVIAPTPARTMPRVIAVWGPVGAPGRTTIAINLAAELAAQGLRVALVDADSYGASIATHLGLLDETPGFAIACRAASTGDLDERELERVAQQSGSKPFHVLAGLPRVQRWPELSAPRVTAVLDTCRSWVDVTVVDAGFCIENDDGVSSDVRAPSRNAATIAALRAADRVIAVGSADPIGISRLLRAHLDLVELVDPAIVDVLVNRVRGSAIGMAPAQQIERTLRRFGGIERAHLVPDDPAACDAAVLAGAPLRESAPKSPACAAIARYAEDRIAPPAVAPRSGAARWLPHRRAATRRAATGPA